MTNKMINQKKVAEMLGVSAVTVRQYTKSGKLSCIRQAGKTYYNESEVVELKKMIESKEQQQKEQEVKPKEQPTKEVKEESIDLEQVISSICTKKIQEDRADEKKVFDLLEKEPPKSWLKVIEGEVRGNGQPVLDLPIEKVEFLLSYIFSWWESEIIEIKQLFKNSFAVTVRVHYRDLTGKLRRVDGVGAVYVAIENEVQKEIPRAEALARKNACKKIGKIFGRDINRDVTEVKIKEQKKPAIYYTLKKKIASAKDFTELEEIKKDVEKQGDKELTELYLAKEFVLN